VSRFPVRQCYMPQFKELMERYRPLLSKYYLKENPKFE
jgi:hypothetical protein